jgi:hypothetical protein
MTVIPSMGVPIVEGCVFGRVLDGKVEHRGYAV